jgi:hypothetical protein
MAGVLLAFTNPLFFSNGKGNLKMGRRKAVALARPKR